MTDTDLTAADPTPPRRANRRLRFLLAINAAGLAVFFFAQLDRSAASRLGALAERLHAALRMEDVGEDSAAARGFKRLVGELGGRPTVLVRRPGYFGVFGRLETFNVGFRTEKFDDEALGRLARAYGDRIVNLELDETGVTDAGLRHLRDMPGLRSLRIRGARPRQAGPTQPSKITDAGMAHIGTLPRLVSPQLSDLPITDAGLASINDLPALQSLHLARTDVLGGGLSRMKSLPRLVILDLDDTNLGEAGLKALAGASSLRYLSLRGVAMTDKDVPRLIALPRLMQLQLQGCGLLDEEIAAMRKAKPGLNIDDR